MRDFVRNNNLLTDTVLKVFRWQSDDPPLTQYEITQIELDNEDIEILHAHTSITPDDDPEYSLLSELLGLSRGPADLQATYEEWMQEVRKIRLPEQSFYDCYQAAFDNRQSYVKGLGHTWRLALQLRDKCAELGNTIAKLKEEHRLFDREYLGDLLTPRAVFTGVLGPGYERTPHSYDEEQVELAVLNGQDRAAAEAAIMRGQNRTAAAKTKGKSLPTKEVAFPVLEKYMMVRPEYTGKTMHELLEDWDKLSSIKLRKETVDKYLTWRRDIPLTCKLFGLDGLVQGKLLYEVFGSGSPGSFRKKT